MGGTGRRFLFGLVLLLTGQLFVSTPGYCQNSIWWQPADCQRANLGITKNVAALLARNQAYMRASTQQPNDEQTWSRPTEFANLNAQQKTDVAKFIKQYKQMMAREHHIGKAKKARHDGEICPGRVGGTRGALASLVEQSAAEIPGGQIEFNAQLDANNLFCSNPGVINDTYRGMGQPYNDNIVGNFFGQIGQLIGKWIAEFIDGWIAGTVQWLVWTLSSMGLQPAIASVCTIAMSRKREACICATTVICELILVKRCGLVGRGDVRRAMFALAALFVTGWITSEIGGVLVGGPELSHMNELWASAIRGGTMAGVGGLVGALAPLLGGADAAAVLGTVGEAFAFICLIVFCIIGLSTVALLACTVCTRCAQGALLCLEPVIYAVTGRSNIASRDWVGSYGLCVVLDVLWLMVLRIATMTMASDWNPWAKCSIGLALLWIGVVIGWRQCKIIWRRCGFDRYGRTKRVSWPVRVL